MATTVQNPFDTQQPNATNTQPSTGGIVASALPKTGQAMTYTPETRQVDAPTQTVQGQVNSILSKDSPLMQRARTLATQQMSQRGLVNSSMAAGAGVAAMTDRALPMAQQDANTYNQVAQDNMTARNNAGMFSAGELNKFGMQQSDQSFTAGQADINRQFQTSERLGSQAFAGEFEVAKQNFTSAQSALDRAQQTALADKSIEAQQALQTAQQNFSGAQAALDRTQQTELQRGQQAFQAGQSSLDRSQQKEILYTQQEFQAAQQKIQNDFSLKVQELQESGQDFRQARDIASREALQKLAELGVQNRFDQEIALKSDQFNVEQLNLERRQIIQNDAELERLGIQIKANNAQIPTNFAANVSNTVMAGVSNIYAQPMDANGKPTADERRAQAQSLVNYANKQIEWAEKFYSTAVPRISMPT